MTQRKRMTKPMALTRALVDLCHRDVVDAGPDPGLGHMDEADYAQLIAATLGARPRPGPLWIFAYGSLIWKPEIAHVEERLALVRGWHRAFRIRLTRWRGTIDTPGLMMGLAPGGQCRGVAYRLPDDDPGRQLDVLFRREMTAKPTTYRPVWLNLATPQGPLSALAFVINPKGRTYAGRLERQQVAEMLADACGHLGSGADYLHSTVANLEARGIRDRNLWELQELVAAVIEARR